VITIEPDEFGATREDVHLALEVENIESRPLGAVGSAVAEALEKTKKFVAKNRTQMNTGCARR